MDELYVPDHIDYQLINGGKLGLLREIIQFGTPIYGYDVELDRIGLDADGILTLDAGYTWDFGSYAIDTPPMVIASAAHDAFCLLTNARMIPWGCRKLADSYFRFCLKANGGGVSRFWRWAGVSIYSQLFARWRDKNDKP